MKIAFVMPWHISERGGGAEVQANYLAQELKLRKYELIYICQTQTKSKINSREIINGIEVSWLKASGRFAWQDQNKYFLALEEYKPDIVLQRISSNVSHQIAKYCRKNNKIFHWFCTDNQSPFKKFHLKNFTQRHAFTFRGSIKYIVFYINAVILDYYRNLGMKGVNIAWSQNRYQKEKLLENFQLKTYTMISGHPIPETVIDSDRNYYNQKVLWCANFGKHKRPEIFIQLAKRMQDTKLEFVMVGGHSKQAYVDELLKDKSDNIQLMGRCSFEEAQSFFNNSTILVNTSISEGFSNTYIQAWLRGVPTLVVGADPNNIISENQLGYNCADLDELEEKLRLLVSTKGLYLNMSTLAKEYAEKNHNIKLMTDNFLKHIVS